MDRSLNELVAIAEDIKRLLIALLIKSGATQAEVAKALGVTQGTVSKIFAVAGSGKSPRKRK